MHLPIGRRVPAMSLVAALALSLSAAAPTGVGAQQLPFEQVVAQLKSADAGARLSALKLLRESGYPEAASPIAPLLSDPEAGIRREALETELELFFGDDGARGRAGGGGWRRRSVSAARAFDLNWSAMPAGRVPMEVVTGVLVSLADPAPAVRTEAAYALGLLGQIDDVPPDLGYKAVIDALAERLGDGDPSVRVAAARASGRVFRRCPAGCGALALDRVGDGLVRLLGDPEKAVQGAAMEGLGEIRYERAVKDLTGAFARYRQGEMAFGALDTLARIGHASSVPLFRSALASSDASFRRSAVEGLARAGTNEAWSAVEAMEPSERDASVALALAFARQRSGRGQEISRLLQALGDRAHRAQVQDYLVELGPPAAPDVAGALARTSGEERVALLEVLGVTGRAAQAPAVEATQNDSDARVAGAARRALARIKLRG